MRRAAPYRGGPVGRRGARAAHPRFRAYQDEV